MNMKRKGLEAAMRKPFDVFRFPSQRTVKAIAPSIADPKAFAKEVDRLIALKREA